MEADNLSLSRSLYARYRIAQKFVLSSRLFPLSIAQIVPRITGIKGRSLWRPSIPRVCVK